MELDDYISAHISPEPEWLAECYRDTWRYRLYPRMCAGHIQGSILTMLTSMVRPRRVLELGTYSGYSTMAIAAGLPEGAMVDTVEVDDEHEGFIKRMIERSPYAGRIRLHIGDAFEIVPRISREPWDLVYIDANKRDYAAYYRMILPLVVSGGYILADNTLWDGHVVEPDAERDPQCRGIMEFNDLVASDPTVTVTILPLRDGLSIIRKNS